MAQSPRRDTTPDPAIHNSDRVLDHSYDGIEEYDNPMPRWWLTTFWLAIVFSAIYALNIGPFGAGKGWIASYEADMKAFTAAHPAPSSDDVSESALVALVSDQKALAVGKTAYDSYCASCHRQDGGGLIGPNLTDDYWLHGAQITDIYRTVVDGVLAKGMPPWGKSLKPEQLTTVVAYVASLHGSNPSDPKAPQGELVTP